jgi:hypothetical protein
MASISLKYKSKSGNLTAPGDVDPGAMIPITTTTLSTNTASVTFSDIPQNYEHLQLRVMASASSNFSGVINFNSDTTATNYYTHAMFGNGATTTAQAYNASYMPYYTGISPNFSSSIIDILDYSNTNKYKTVKSLFGQDANGSGNVGLTSLLWKNTNAITSIRLTVDGSATWSQYSHFALYGIKRAGA